MIIHMITALSSLSVVRTSGEKLRHLPNIHLALKKSALILDFLRYSTVESEFVIWIFVWKASETHDTSPGVVTEVPVADIHQLDDPNDVIPRLGQWQIVTCLKYDGAGCHCKYIFVECYKIYKKICFCFVSVGTSCYDLYFDLWWFSKDLWYCWVLPLKRHIFSLHACVCFCCWWGSFQHVCHFVGSSDVNIRKYLPRCGLCRTSTHASLSRLHCLQCCSLAFRVYQNPSVELWNCPCLAIQRVCCSL